MNDFTFKSILHDDCKRIFLNTDEFAEYRKINGKSIRVIIDQNELIDRNAGSPHSDGTYAGTVLIYVLADEFGAKPSIGSKLIIDGKRSMIIKECTDECGIYAITAEEVRIR